MEGTAVLVDDGTAADSLGCGVLVNNAAISGNIAVVYRGTCEFGVKALNAQNAGAIGGQTFYVDNIQIIPVPEPGMAALMGLGLSAAIAFRRRTNG